MSVNLTPIVRQALGPGPGRTLGRVGPKQGWADVDFRVTDIVSADIVSGPDIGRYRIGISTIIPEHRPISADVGDLPRHLIPSVP